MVDGRVQPGVSSGGQTQQLCQEPPLLGIPGKGVQPGCPPRATFPENPQWALRLS